MKITNKWREIKRRQRKKQEIGMRMRIKRVNDTNKNKVEELETIRKALNDLNKKEKPLT